MLRKQKILILDGGLATELEKRGADLKNRLWSAKLLIENPDLIRQVHHDFMAAGADIVITASYQASIPGFVQAGVSVKEAENLIRLSVELACEARDAFCDSEQSRKRLRPMVAASIGPYGACLADGSEYRGDYALGKDELIKFHRPRMEILSETDADLFAFETIPSQLEAETLLELLGEFPNTKAWLSFSCKDEVHVSHGEQFCDCVALAENHAQIEAIGVNCTRPEYIPGLLKSAFGTELPLIAYPNSGEAWNAVKREWAEERSQSLNAVEWIRAGARLVGGCCRVGVDDISSMRKAVNESYP